MKKLFLLSISVLLSVTLYAGEPFATYSFSSTSITKFEASTIAGNITLTGDAGEKATVQVFISGNNQTDEQIKQILDEYYIVDVSVANGKLFAVVKHQKELRRQQELDISFTINVPKHVAGKMNSASGNISINETSGDIDFNTASGSLMIERVSGKISGNTASGNINLTNSTNNISLNTANGNVSVNNCTGNIHLNSANGNLLANNIEGNISLNTANGTVKVSDIKGDINLNTANGNVTANNIAGTLNAGSASGNMVLKDISGNLNIKNASKGNNNKKNTGNIDVTMIHVDKYVVISNNSTNVNLTLPAKNGYKLNVNAEKVEVSGIMDFSGKKDMKTLVGNVGSGGAKIEISKTQQVNIVFK